MWGVARDLRKSSIVTSLQADSRVPHDGRNGILVPSRRKCGDASSVVQANYLLNSLSSSVWSSNNRSRLASSAYRMECGVRSTMKTSVVNILCPTNLLKYVLYMVILNDKRIFRESLYFCNYFTRTVFLTFFAP